MLLADTERKVVLGHIGDEGRNHFYGPHYTNADMSLSKTMTLTERFKIQLRSEFFNEPPSIRAAPPGGRNLNSGAFHCHLDPVGRHNFRPANPAGVEDHLLVPGRGRMIGNSLGTAHAVPVFLHTLLGTPGFQ
jgi:hypothetical protein